MEIKRLDRLSPEDLLPMIKPLVEESEREGYNMLRRLADDYESGANGFDLDEEALFGCFDGDNLVGIGGLNVDPFEEDATVGRVRRVYVSPSWRHRGVGRMLMVEITERARMVGFRELRLRTDTAEASTFYENLGFERIDDDSSTHTRSV